MPGPEHELPGFQANPNEFDKCSSCGTLLTSKQEQEMKLCKECQRRHKDKEIEYDESE
ncbi:hypothetical protein QRD89_17450 [Halobacillus sp. ACCC02827]|uniref:hypothetical protein n=1 Tax=Bacillaceae TaxID=186817 RepID=UPI0002A50129|nr:MULTISPECIES: hypothetical protein [Bacillaceae]ELK47442.1 hypothetical protein D479_06683 [Halobacillus sp. BAB-2008]WJE15485.1 hypothetical protein QRD89_17450 [Halobacillus sp. ACCC02827]